MRYAPFFNCTFAYEIYYGIYFYEIYFYGSILFNKQFTQAPDKFF